MLSAAPNAHEVAVLQLERPQLTDWLQTLDKPFPSITKMSLSFWDATTFSDPKFSTIFPNVKECDFTEFKNFKTNINRSSGFYLLPSGAIFKEMFPIVGPRFDDDDNIMNN